MAAEAQRVDLLIGLPTCNHARTIEAVTRAIVTGLTKYFPDVPSMLLNADCGSQDNTAQIWEQLLQEFPAPAVRGERVVHSEKMLKPFKALSDKCAAYRVILNHAQDLNVTACAIIDPEVSSFTPEWLEALIRPVYTQDYEYVAPLYRRHKFEGTITNNILYPLTRALYGKRIRQPTGGDFALSGKLAGQYLSKAAWQQNLSPQGIDLWMTTSAIAEGYRVCQTALGRKLQAAKAPPTDLPTMLAAVVGAAFSLMEEHQVTWLAVTKSEAVTTFGEQPGIDLESVQINVERMVKALRQGLRDLSSVWEIILSQETQADLLQLELQDQDEFRFPQELWVRVIYDFALAYHEQVLHRDHLLKSLTPLYLGRTASFILETQTSTPAQIEQNTERLCELFEVMKPYLAERWR